MFNNFKANILKYCDSSLHTLTLLKKWMQRNASFNSFDTRTFSASSLRIASAKDERGNVICLCPLETVFLMSAYAVNPAATPEEAQQAGDILDSTIAHEAQQAGVSKLLLVVPKDLPYLPEGDWKEVRVYERFIPQTINEVGIDDAASSQVTQYLN